MQQSGVHPSVPSTDHSSGVWWVCYWTSRRQEISFDSGQQQRRRSSKCGQCHVYSHRSRLITDLFNQQKVRSMGSAQKVEQTRHM